MEKKYDFQDRLISFAGDLITFVSRQDKDFVGNYLFNQILRSSGSAALNFAEGQSAYSSKDYIHKMTIALKELRETEVNLRIMAHIEFGGEKRKVFQDECLELIKILTTIIKNRRLKTEK